MNDNEILVELAANIFKRTSEKLGSKIVSLEYLPSVQTPQAKTFEYIRNIYNLLLEDLGADLTKKTFETELSFLRDKYGAGSASYLNLLKILPVPVLETERFKLLSRQELESEITQRVKELEDIKANLGKIVGERTALIIAERNKLSVILSGITDTIIALDLNHNIISFNKAAEHLTGFPAKSIINANIGSVIKVFDKSQELPPAVYAPIRNDDFEGILFNKKDLKIIAGVTDNSVKETSVNFTAGTIRESQSLNLGCIITIHDVTDEKQLESMKLDFVSMAAHELRTPLTTVQGYLSVFINENSKNFTDEQNMFLQRMQKANNQLMLLTENLLNVTRIEKGNMPLNLEPMDWVSVVQQATDALADKAKEKNIKLTLTASPVPIPQILVDKLRISEVLINLISNGILYTQSGGEVNVYMEVKNDEVATHVKDNGRGISKEAMPHLFTKFFRAVSKLEMTQGTGLGLFIAKGIVDLHHGKIWVDSEVGKGSEFSFSLPFSRS